MAEAKFPLHFPILFEASRSSSLKEIARRAEDRALTPLEVKTLQEYHAGAGAKQKRAKESDAISELKVGG